MSQKDKLSIGQYTQKSSSTILQQKSGIPGLDEVLNGGLPNHILTLLSGTSGTGKTIFSFQWLFDGVRQGENGIYISITEPLFTAVRNIESMDFYDKKIIEQQKIRLIDIKEGLGLSQGIVDSQSILNYIEKQVKENNAKRVVIDSITAVLYTINDKARIRQFIFELKKVLATLGCTTILTSEAPEIDRYSAYGVEEFVSDGIIVLSNTIGENQILRNLRVIKMRGINFRTGTVIFDITSSGILLYPKIPINRNVATTEFKHRLSSGIKELDDLCDGGNDGFPQGHVVMVAGNTGTGKTTFGLHFLIEGLKKGECGIYVALEESSSQIRKTALAHGWDLEKYEKSGKLVFINPDLIDINPNKLLYKIIDTLNKIGATRVVIDSVSSLESATMNKIKVREFLIQFAGFMKTKGATSLLTYLSEEAFGAVSGQLIGGGSSSELRLSSIVDGIILLRYVEREQSVAKLLNILKMRGAAHSKNIWQFEVNKEGVKIGQIFHK